MRTQRSATDEPVTDVTPRLIRRVGVTGGAGDIALFVVPELAAAGYDVVAVDRRPPPQSMPATFRAADLLDQGAIGVALGDCDAIVHLASPNANPLTASRQNREDEVRMTANLLAHAERERVSRVVLASSEVAVGYARGASPFPFQSFPVDESHPLLPTDEYGIAKQSCERMASESALRSGIPIVALRPSWVLALDYMTKREWGRRFHGRPGAHPYNFWSYVDARDVARAFRLALEAPLSGFHSFFLAAPDTRHYLPTRDLLRHFLADPLPPGAEALRDRQSILSTQRAERLLGWRATRTWPDLPSGRVGALMRRIGQKLRRG